MMNYVPDKSKTEKKVDIWWNPEIQKWVNGVNAFDNPISARDDLKKQKL